VATLTQHQILPAVTEIVATVFDLPAETLTADRDLRAIEGIDSVKVLRAVAMIEQRFDVELEDADIFAARTTADLTALIGKAR
jgi:acyl carrier protein